MDFLNQYRGLRFDRRIPAIPPVLTTLAIAGGVFTVMWLAIPTDTLYWILLPMVLMLVWLARFGRREALAVIIGWLRRLENL